MFNERQLVRRIASGDRHAFEVLVDTYGASVHRLARRHANTESDAEDITQEIFVAVFSGIPKFRGESSLRTWIFRIAMNHCLKHRSRVKPTAVPYDDDHLTSLENSSDPAAAAETEELATRVHGALDTLSEAHRSVVLLHEIEGLTYAECAGVLEVPVGTVKSRLFHAFRNLRQGLSAYVQDSGAESALPGALVIGGSE